MTRYAAILAMSLLAARQPALAAGSTLDALTLKAPVAAADSLPILPVGGTTLMKTAASNLADFVLTSVKFTIVRSASDCLRLRCRCEKPTHLCPWTCNRSLTAATKPVATGN